MYGSLIQFFTNYLLIKGFVFPFILIFLLEYVSELTITRLIELYIRYLY